MITASLYRARTDSWETRELTSFGAGVALLNDGYERALSAETTGFCMVVGNPSDREFPTMNCQQFEKGWLLQVFACERNSPHGREGWYCLVEPSALMAADHSQLVTTVWSAQATEGFVEVQFAEGVLISTKLLIGDEVLRRALGSYDEAGGIKQWLRGDSWRNLGLL
jgi:hypothetical protein